MPTPELQALTSEIRADPKWQDYAADIGIVGNFYERYVVPHIQGAVGKVRLVGIGAQIAEPLAVAALFPQATSIEASDITDIAIAQAEPYVDLLMNMGRRTVIQLGRKIQFDQIDASDSANFPDRSTLTSFRELGGGGTDKTKILQTLVDVTEHNGYLVITTLTPPGGITPSDELEIRRILQSLEAAGKVRKIVDDRIDPPLQVNLSNDGHLFLYQVL